MRYDAMMIVMKLLSAISWWNENEIVSNKVSNGMYIEEEWSDNRNHN